MAVKSKDITVNEVREAAESDLETFIRLVAPKQVLGHVHVDLCRWMIRQNKKTHQLILLPRDHGKSRMVAFYVAWLITRRPDIRVLYISSTANLAEKQLKFIKDILTSDIYRRYWPDMVKQKEGEREKWTNGEISVDHPKRKEEGVRDPTVFTGGLTTSLTGLHCDVAVMDDVVVYENAYTQDGREKVKSQYSLLSSIQGADSEVIAVGTKYHPKDLYADLSSMTAEVYDKSGDIIDKESVYEIFERAVEDQGDGTGQFLWPRQQRSDGRWFGFDQNILARKRAEYLDRTQFRAQYYNDPNDPSESAISKSRFQYYDRRYLTKEMGKWYYKDRRLNIVAAIDFGASISKRSDFTAIVIVGVDRDNNYYVLEVDRFKTDRIVDVFEHITTTHRKWEYQRLVAETTAAQNVVVQELKNQYIKPMGMLLSIIEVKPTRHQGSKQDRLSAILEPKYDNQMVWHYEGGNCEILEEELISRFPQHDDCKDALASAIEHCVVPSQQSGRRSSSSANQIKYHPRFGGVL